MDWTGAFFAAVPRLFLWKFRRRNSPKRGSRKTALEGQVAIGERRSGYQRRRPNSPSTFCEDNRNHTRQCAGQSVRGVAWRRVCVYECCNVCVILLEGQRAGPVRQEGRFITTPSHLPWRSPGALSSPRFAVRSSAVSLEASLLPIPSPSPSSLHRLLINPNQERGSHSAALAG